MADVVAVYVIYIANLLGYISTKYYRYGLKFDKVIAKNYWPVFIVTQCTNKMCRNFTNERSSF